MSEMKWPLLLVGIFGLIILGDVLHEPFNAWWAFQVASDDGELLENRIANARFLAERKAFDDLHLIYNEYTTEGSYQAALIDILAEFEDPDLATLLRPAITDRSSAVREAAARNLPKLGREEALPKLRELLKDEAANVRIHAALALMDYRVTDGLDLLLEYLAQPALVPTVDLDRVHGSLKAFSGYNFERTDAESWELWVTTWRRYGPIYGEDATSAESRDVFNTLLTGTDPVNQLLAARALALYGTRTPNVKGPLLSYRNGDPQVLASLSTRGTPPDAYMDEVTRLLELIERAEATDQKLAAEAAAEEDL